MSRSLGLSRGRSPKSPKKTLTEFSRFLTIRFLTIWTDASPGDSKHSRTLNPLRIAVERALVNTQLSRAPLPRLSGINPQGWLYSSTIRNRSVLESRQPEPRRGEIAYDTGADGQARDDPECTPTPGDIQASLDRHMARFCNLLSN
jgi:hypothetical protein